MSDQPPVDEGENYRYRIRLLVSHPTIDPARITSVLERTPGHSAIAGTPTRKGGTHVHRRSFWNHSYEVAGDRRFFSKFSEAMDWLEPHRDFLAGIVKDSSGAMLIVHLPGDINIGDVLKWPEMARLSALKIDLGIEVFPDMR